MDDFVEIYDNALSPEFCAEIIARFDESNIVAPGRIGQGVDPTKKDSRDLTITGLPDWQPQFERLLDATVGFLEQYMGKYTFTLVGALSPAVLDPQTNQPVTITHDNFEQFGRPRLRALIEKLYGSGPVNVQRYEQATGGYHHWHSEIYPRAESHDALYRVLYYQYYLNTVADGGETEFFYQRRKIQAREGRLVIAPAGFTHTHKGHIPRSGHKYIVTSWVIFQGPRTMYGTP